MLLPMRGAITSHLSLPRVLPWAVCVSPIMEVLGKSNKTNGGNKKRRHRVTPQFDNCRISNNLTFCVIELCKSFDTIEVVGHAARLAAAVHGEDGIAHIDTAQRDG